MDHARVFAISLACALAACGARTGLPAPEAGEGGSDEGGGGHAVCEPGGGAFVLAGTLRDFRDDHPDFEEGVLGADRGIVEPELGPDGLPVYAGSPDTPTTSGREAFDTWYRDVPGTNQRFSWSGTLVPVPLSSILVYDGLEFFPLDG